MTYINMWSLKQNIVSFRKSSHHDRSQHHHHHKKWLPWYHISYKTIHCKSLFQTQLVFSYIFLSAWDHMTYLMNDVLILYLVLAKIIIWRQAIPGNIQPNALRSYAKQYVQENGSTSTQLITYKTALIWWLRISKQYKLPYSKSKSLGYRATIHKLWFQETYSRTQPQKTIF